MRRAKLLNKVKGRIMPFSKRFIISKKRIFLCRNLFNLCDYSLGQSVILSLVSLINRPRLERVFRLDFARNYRCKNLAYRT